MQNALEVKKNGTVISKITKDGNIVGTVQDITLTAGTNITIVNNNTKQSGNILLVAVRIQTNASIVAGALIATINKTITGSSFLTSVNEPQQAYISGDSIIAYKPLNNGLDIWLYGIALINS